MKQRLQPVIISNLAGGLNKSAKSVSLLTENEMSESENVRHLGQGRLARRDGMKRFATAGIAPIQPSATENAGRLLFPAIRRITATANKRVIVEAIAIIKNRLYSCADNGAPSAIELKDGSEGAPLAHLPWKPYSSADADRQHEDHPNAGIASLNNRIYIGSNNTDTDRSIAGATASVMEGMSYGVLLIYTTPFVFGGQEDSDIVGLTSGASGYIGYINDSYKALLVYNWNGIPFENGETIEAGDGVTDTLVNSAEYGQCGIVLDHDNTPTGTFQARKWGIENPHVVLAAVEGGAGAIEAGTYNIKYTFIRYEGGSLSAGDNPKLSGGELVSESAPSTGWDVVIVADKKISLVVPSTVSSDPQVTHMRVYRTDGSTTVYRHVADIAIDDAGPINDNLDVTTLQLVTTTIDTTGYKAFGQDGENSGDIIESGDHRVLVAGNEDYPYKVYMSRALTEHKHSEYFYSSLNIGGSPGESITEIKFWNNTFWIFTERSLYKIVDINTETDVVSGHEIVTRGIGCAAKRGTLDMGDHLLVLSQHGLLTFNGSLFDKVPLTSPIKDILGTDLRNAIISQDDEYVYIISETSRELDLMITLKYVDGSYACGTDKLHDDLELPEKIGFVPPLENFGNTMDDSNYMLGLFRNTDDGGAVKYWIGKYNLSGQNKDLLFLTAGDTEKGIVAKFSPRVFDFGAFSEANLEKVISFIMKCGIDTTTKKLPTGTFLIKIYVNPTENGDAKIYTEVKLKPAIDRTISKVRTTGDPIQPKYTDAFNASQQTQSGGVFSTRNNPAALFADYQEILYRGAIDHMLKGRFWKMLFQYEDEANFEFTDASFKFVVEEPSL